LGVYDFSEEIKNIEQPVFLLYGLKDPGTILAIHALREILDGAKVDVIDEAGHFPFVERPVQTAQLIVDYLNSD